jgi:hypothetical protein
MPLALVAGGQIPFECDAAPGVGRLWRFGRRSAAQSKSRDGPDRAGRFACGTNAGNVPGDQDWMRQF